MELINHKTRCNGMITLSVGKKSNMYTIQKKDNSLEKFTCKMKCTDIIKEPKEYDMEHTYTFRYTLDGESIKRKALARLLNVDESTLSKYCRGKKAFTVNGHHLDIDRVLRKKSKVNIYREKEKHKNVLVQDAADLIGCSSTHVRYLRKIGSTSKNGWRVKECK